MNTFLEPLRDYSVKAPNSLPPDILPWERSADWNLDHAARVTLGLLVAGDRSSDLLFAAADYLLVFCNEGYGRPVLEDALLLGIDGNLCGPERGLRRQLKVLLAGQLLQQPNREQLRI